MRTPRSDIRYSECLPAEGSGQNKDLMQADQANNSIADSAQTNYLSFSESPKSICWQDVIDSFAERELPESTILLCIKKAIEDFFIFKYKSDITVKIENGTIEINKYLVSQDKILKEKEIKLVDLNENAITYIKKRIINYINLEKQRSKYIKLKRLVKTIITGSIANININQNFAMVYIENDFIGKVLCYYPLSEQPKHERVKYELGDNYIFFVKNVFISKVHNKYKITVVLSRTSKKMVELMFKIQGYNVKCTKRLAGKISIIKSKKYIPANVRLSIESELKEKILIVKDTS